MKKKQSVLYIPTPDAESAVGTLREKYDPGAPYGIKAHITTLFPFKSTEELTQDIIDILKGLYEQVKPFDFALEKVDIWPGVVFLLPEPRKPFIEITELVVAKYPENPWFGGQFPEINPHLTIANEIAESDFDSVKEKIITTVEGKLPIRTTAIEVHLLEEGADGMWTHTHTFPFSGK